MSQTKQKRILFFTNRALLFQTIFFQEENEKVLKDYLLAHQQGVGCQLPTSPISIKEFKQAYQV